MSASRFFSKRLLIHLLLRVTLCIIALASAYNSCKAFSRYTGSKLTGVEKAAIKATFPWAILFFTAIYLMYHFKNRSSSPKFSDLKIIALYAVAVNLCYAIVNGNHLVSLLALNLSVCYLLVFVFILKQLIKIGLVLLQKTPNIQAAMRTSRKAWHRRLGVATVSFVFFAIPLVMCYHLYIQQYNTIYHNGHWFSSKLELEKGVMGSASFVVTKTALAMNRLNLGAWHGYHEIMYCKKLLPAQIEFDFLVPPSSYVTFIFNKNLQQFSGLRFSNNKHFPHIYFNATAEGKFTTKQTFTIPSLQTRWNHAKIIFQDHYFSLFVNDEKVHTDKLQLSFEQLVGFRGGYQKALIDNVVITSRNPQFTIKDSFAPRHRWQGLLVIAILILIINICTIIWARRKKQDKPWIFYPLAVNFFLTVASSSLWLIDFVYFSHRHYSPSDFKGYPNRIEFAEEINARLNKQYSTSDNQLYRVLFIGSSQTWGAGVKKEQQTFVARVEKLLNQRQDGKRYQCINTGISGMLSPALWDFYHRDWVKWKPQLVVINLSNNDGATPRFPEQLEKFVTHNRKSGIHTIFVQEPNSAERNYRTLHKKHELMAQIANEHDIPIVDMHAYLLKHQDQGFLWWDFVHLTAFGQELFANRLYSEIDKVLSQ